MNILLVEDNEQYLEMFTQQLSKLGTVIAFKSSNETRRFLHDSDIKFDLIVCDHNIQRFEADLRSKAYGTEIYYEFRMGLDVPTPFIHFSVEPCPEKYEESKKDPNFYSLKKSSAVDLYTYIESTVLKNKP